MKKYGFVKRMTKREGGFKKFKIDYYKYLRSIYDINLKKWDIYLMSQGMI